MIISFQLDENRTILLDMPYEVEIKILIHLDIEDIRGIGKRHVPLYVWRRKSQYLEEAAACGNFIGVQHLIENNITNVMAYSGVETKEYTMALRLAAEHGHLNIVRYMADRAIDHDVDLRIDYIPLLLSASNGHLVVARYLVEMHGSNIHANNECILIQCAANGHLHVIEYLVGRGADIHAQNDKAATVDRKVI
jgi:hypothetical protein